MRYLLAALHRSIGHIPSAICSLPLLNGVARLPPGPHPTVHRPDVGVAHLPEALGRQGGPIPTAALEDDLGTLVRDHRIDISLQNASHQMRRDLRIVRCTLVVRPVATQVKRHSRILIALTV